MNPKKIKVRMDGREIPVIDRSGFLLTSVFLTLCAVLVVTLAGIPSDWLGWTWLVLDLLFAFLYAWLGTHSFVINVDGFSGMTQEQQVQSIHRQLDDISEAYGMPGERRTVTEE